MKIFNKHMPDHSYGMEMVLDIYNCDASRFTAEFMGKFVRELVDVAGMQAVGEPVIWTDEGIDPAEMTEPHLKGISVLQWIKTSNILIHAMDLTGLALINLFSCKPFDVYTVSEFCRATLGGNKTNVQVIKRGQVSKES